MTTGRINQVTIVGGGNAAARKQQLAAQRAGPAKSSALASWRFSVDGLPID